MIYDGYGNALAWDDRDLEPLGEKPSQPSKKTTIQTISLTE